MMESATKIVHIHRITSINHLNKTIWIFLSDQITRCDIDIFTIYAPLQAYSKLLDISDGI